VRRALLLALLLSLIVAVPAGACSCVAESPQSKFQRAEFAFIGTAIDKRGSFGEQYTTFRVDERFKGAFGATVELRTGTGSSCDVSFGMGDQVGLLPHQDGDRFAAGSCSTMAPDEMRAAAQAGEVRTVVAGSFEGARVLALDADGAIVARGSGFGDGLSVDVCPGSRYAVETALVDNGHGLAIRRLPGLEVVREMPIPTRGEGRVLVHCPDENARRVSVLASAGGRTLLLRRKGTSFKRLTSVPASAAGFGYGTAYLQVRREVVAIDIASGSGGTIAKAPRMEGELAGGPEGFVAGRAGTRAVLVGPTGRVWKAPAGHHEGPVAWSTNLRRPRIAVTAGGGNLLVFNGLLKRRDRIEDFTVGSLTARGNRLWGLGEFGELLTALLPGGPARQVGTVPGEPRDIAAVVPG
jgi:hypothetical protein